MINADNFKDVFTKRLQKADTAVRAVMEAYAWANENIELARKNWTKFSLSWARSEIRRRAGIDPSVYVGLVKKFGGGREGVELVDRFGVGECLRARAELGDKPFRELVEVAGNLKSPEDFSKELETKLEAIEEHAKKLGEQRRKKEEENSSRGNATKLSGDERKELQTLRRRVKELENENRELKARLHTIEEAFRDPSAKKASAAS